MPRYKFPQDKFYIQSALGDLVFSIKDNGVKPGNYLVVNNYTNSKGQQFEFIPDHYHWDPKVKEGFYYGFIKHIDSGLVLDIEGEKGPYIILYPKKAVGDNQLWRYDGEHLTSKINGQVLDVKNNLTKPGTYVICYPKNNQPNQKWRLIHTNGKPYHIEDSEDLDDDI